MSVVVSCGSKPAARSADDRRASRSRWIGTDFATSRWPGGCSLHGDLIQRQIDGVQQAGFTAWIETIWRFYEKAAPSGQAFTGVKRIEQADRGAVFGVRGRPLTAWIRERLMRSGRKSSHQQDVFAAFDGAWIEHRELCGSGLFALHVGGSKSYCRWSWPRSRKKSASFVTGAWIETLRPIICYSSLHGSRSKRKRRTPSASYRSSRLHGGSKPHDCIAAVTSRLHGQRGSNLLSAPMTTKADSVAPSTVRIEHPRSDAPQRRRLRSSRLHRARGSKTIPLEQFAQVLRVAPSRRKN